MKHYKTGRWSKIEIQFIRDNYKSMTVEELSKHLDRPPDKITEIVGELHVPDDIRQSELNIRRTHEWKQITQQLSPDEQETFLYHWREIINQLKSDITHTERMQVMDICRTEILINRALKRLYEVQLKIEDTDKEIKAESLKEEKDIDKIIRMKEAYSGILASMTAIQKEHQLLTERKQSIIRDIKGTRDQRKKRIEDEGKATLTSWVVSLIENPELRRNLGIEIEKFRHAVNVEYERLSDYYTYADGKVDQPVLNSDNVKEDNI